MKFKLFESSGSNYVFTPGDIVTYYNGRVGYANYDAKFIRYETNKYGVQMAVIDPCYEPGGCVHPSNLIPSEKEYFMSLSRDDVLTMDFVASLTHKDDSMFCYRFSVPRVDRDQGMENITGLDADIINVKEGQQDYRVVVTSYITKNYRGTREYEEENHASLDNKLISEALEVLKSAPEVVVNYAGYHRTFKLAGGVS